jgi:hypothetical protein
VEILEGVVRGIFELPITYVNGKYGLAAAWIFAATMVSLTIGLLYVVITWWL